MQSIARMATICSLLLIFTISLAAAASSTPAITQRAAATAVQKPQVAAPAGDWQKKWDDVVAAARKEGELLIYLNSPSEARSAFADAFKRRFGITVDIVIGSGASLSSRFDAEYGSGIHRVDLLLTGVTSMTASKGRGFLSPITPMLILPEVTDPKAWLGHRLPLFDKEGILVAYLSQLVPPVVYNAGLLKDGQVTSYRDLLKPEWKGKMVMFDPTIGGAANFWAAGLTQELGTDKANEYLTALIKQQEVVVTREMGQQMDWVSRGKYSLGLFPQPPAVSQHLKAGVPIAAFSFKELSGVSPSSGGLGLPTHSPHPNATTLFINWFLSKEGQTLAVKSIGMPSSRLDVPPEGVNPMFIIKPGQKFFMQSEELNQNIIKWIETWRKIFHQARG